MPPPSALPSASKIASRQEPVFAVRPGGIHAPIVPPQGTDAFLAASDQCLFCGVHLTEPKKTKPGGGLRTNTGAAAEPKPLPDIARAHPLDGNPKNLRDRNLKPACHLCDQVTDLQRVAAEKSGRLALVPGLSQTQINALFRTMVVLGDTLPDIADTIRLLTDYFDLASKRLDDLGRDRDSEGRPRALVPSDPGALAQALAERTPVPGAPAPNFGALRLIPTERAFTDKARMEWRAQFGLFAAGSEADAQKVMLEETARLLKIKVPDERG